jgi:hypothetical protein
MSKLYGGPYKVTLPGESFTWEPDEMMLSDWSTVEDHFGGTFDGWIDGINDRDAAACRVLIWWLRRRKGIELDLAAVDFKIRQLAVEPLKEPAADPEGEAATSTSVAATSEPSSNGAGDLATSTP